MKFQLLAGFCVASLITLNGTFGAEGSTPDPDADATRDVIVARPFDLQDVRLEESPFRAAMERDEAYLLRLDPDRLLYDFRVNVGLPADAQPYGGWETPTVELRGHSTGHYLSACSLMYRSTGNSELKRRIDYLVAELARCQAASPAAGFHEGYLSAFPESFIDRVETGKRVWAPWYTLHKVMAGLFDAYHVAGNKQALDVLVKMADWIRGRVDALTPEQMQASLKTEFGGMNEVLANLYGVTGNPEHLKLAQAFNQKEVLDPLAQGQDRLTGLHANTQIPKMIGMARQYELTAEPRDRRIAETFWDRVALHRSYVIGGHSDREHFFPVTDFAKHLSPETAETCNTYNMLKLTRHLFSWDPDAQLMDFYERGLYNHILASQDPDTGMFVYLMSLEPGHFKSYSTPENSFWCCVGTGMENHAKYGGTIFFHDEDTLWLNLFIPADLTWAEKGLKVRQETRFPESDTTRLTFEADRPVELALRVRHPSWAQGPLTITIDGQPWETRGEPGSYEEIKRTWSDGDTIEIKLPMSLHAESLPGAPQYQALLYGPIVLAGELGTEDMPDLYVKDQTELLRRPVPVVPAFVTSASDEWLQKIKPVPGEALTFRTHDLGRPEDVTLRPFFRVHHERYSVYWRIVTPEDWEKEQAEIAAAREQLRAAEDRAVDKVVPGDPASEEAHAFAGEKTDSGKLAGRTWRRSYEGGFMSYELATKGADHLALLCTFPATDAYRMLNITVDGTKIATATVEGQTLGQFAAETYPLPDDLVRGKDRITVRFEAAPWNGGGSIFGCALVQPE